MSNCRRQSWGGHACPRGGGPRSLTARGEHRPKDAPPSSLPPTSTGGVGTSCDLGSINIKFKSLGSELFPQVCGVLVAVPAAGMGDREGRRTQLLRTRSEPSGEC